ncbi:MAG: type II secretion system protein [Erysipelotrichaceae bacterium]|nr:type II secretion system protein [Erysipelotrichaceae bacterium]
MMKKLRKRNGETIIETLIATIIVALALIMLAGALVSASKVNREIKKLDTVLKWNDAYETKDILVKHYIDNRTDRNQVKVHTSANGYVYYSVDK